MTFNTTAEYIALYFSLLTGISMFINDPCWTKKKVTFTCCSFLISINCFLNILTSSFIDIFGQIPLWVNNTVTVLYFSTLFMLIFCFAVYFIMIIEKENTQRQKRYLTAVFLPILAGVLISAASPMTKLLFYYDDNGYNRGPLSKITYVILIYSVLVIIVSAIKSGSKITGRMKKLIIMFPIMSGIVMTLQFILDDVLLTGTAAVSLLLLMLLFLEHGIVDIDSDTGFNGHKSFITAVGNRMNKLKSFSCALIEISNVQELCDILGRQKYNRLIIMIAGYFDSVLPHSLGYRYSDNGFAFIFDKMPPDETEKYLSELQQRFSEKFCIDGTDVLCGISISTVHCPCKAENEDQLSDMLEYGAVRAKLRKARSVYVCGDDTYRAVTRRKQIAEILKHELNSDDNNFEVYYQPIYDISKHCFRTAESLVRLNKTEIGPIYPDEFIPIAEEMGMIVRLGEIVLDKACGFIASLIRDNVDFDAISVNFSVHQTMRDDIIDEVKNVVKKHNIPAEKLRIEITESVLIDNFAHVKQMMDKLGVIGIKFYMDDFGTGYSNFSNMVELPFEYLKIDKSLVRSAEKSEKAYSVLNFISKAFINQNIKILTEGVETEKQEEIVSSIGASYIQGFRFARPVPGETAKEYFLGKRNDALLHTI